jgi:hypothetical protein
MKKLYTNTIKIIKLPAYVYFGMQKRLVLVNKNIIFLYNFIVLEFYSVRILNNT